MADMLPTYREGLEIDRINNNSGDYTPDNCRWVTSKENNRNRRNNQIFDGRCTAEWAELLNVEYGMFSSRCYRQGHKKAIAYYRSKK